MPEATTSCHGTVPSCIMIVVTVERRELFAIVIVHGVACVARVAVDRQSVLGCLAVDDERAVLGPVPLTTARRLEVKPHLVLTVLGQLMQQLVTEPVVTRRAAESRSESLPRATEVRRAVDVLYDEQRRASFCIQHHAIRSKLSDK